MTAINILGKIVTINGQRFRVTSNFFEDGYILEEIDDSKVKIIEESSDFDVINNRLDKLEKDVKDILKIVIPIYKDKDKYEVLQNTMNDIGLMSIMPSDILDKCIELAKTGSRDKSLEIIKQNEKVTLIN